MVSAAEGPSKRAPAGGWSISGALRSLLREPTAHFLLLGALLFPVHRWLAGDPRTIAISPGLKADLARRFRDDNGRPPTAAEAEKALDEWKRDEAVYREAMREKLYENDRAVRTILIDKLRARAMAEVAKRAPSDAEADAWLESHRRLYETPKRFTLEWLSVTATGPASTSARTRMEAKLTEGADPRSLGVTLFGATLTEPEMRERWGDVVAARIGELALGQWRAIDGSPELLVRVSRVEGGLPPPEELRARVVSDCAAALQQQAAARALAGLVAKYRFEAQR